MSPAPIPAPAETLPPTDLPEDPYSSVVGGYAFLPIAGWETEAFLGLASMQPPAADERTGPGILLVGGQHNRALDLDQAYESLTAEFRDQTFGDLSLETPEEASLAGYPARAAELRGLEGETAMAGRLLVVLVSPVQSFFAFGFATQEAWDNEVGAIFEALLDTVTFFDPLPLDGQEEGEGGPEPGAGSADDAPTDPPDGFLWRLGGQSTDAEPGFEYIAGLASDSEGFVYTAERGRGIRIFDPHGQPIGQLKPDGFSDFDDVAVSETGGGLIATAAWGSSWITLMDFSGQVQARFGSQGDGPGAFGNTGFLAIALDRDNRVYVLDASIKDGRRTARLQSFDPGGGFLDAWDLGTDFVPQALAAYTAPDPAGDRIFLLGAGEIRAYDLSGTLARPGIGAEALATGEARALAVDAAGNFYIAMANPGRVLKLDPDGGELAAFGFDADPGEAPMAPGGFHDPTGIAVSWDGARVYVSDYGGFNQAFLTAFEFE